MAPRNGTGGPPPGAGGGEPPAAAPCRRGRQPRRDRRRSSILGAGAGELTQAERGQRLVTTTVDRWLGETRQRRLLDRQTIRENRVVFVLAALGVVCMMLHEREVQESIISGRYYGPDAYSYMDIAIPALTALLVWRLAKLYGLYSEAKRVAWRFSDRWEAFVCSSLRYKFALEVAVALVMPLPTWLYVWAGVGGVPGWLRHVGLFMFLRVYAVARVIRDVSPVHKHRHAAAQHRGVKKVRVGSLFAMKANLEEHPVAWVLLATALTVAFFSYAFLVTERTERLNGEETLIEGPVDAIWFVCVTLTSTGYGDLTPSTYVGLSLAMAEQVVGLCLTSLFVAVVLDQISMGPHEAEVVNWTQGLNMRIELRNTAAHLIQHWWFTIRYLDAATAAAAARGAASAKEGEDPEELAAAAVEQARAASAAQGNTVLKKFRRSGFAAIAKFRVQHERYDRYEKDEVTREMLIVEEVSNELQALKRIITDRLGIIKSQETFLMQAVDRALQPDKEEVEARILMKQQVAQPTARSRDNVRRQFRPRSMAPG